MIPGNGLLQVMCNGSTFELNSAGPYTRTKSFFRYNQKAINQKTTKASVGPVSRPYMSSAVAAGP